MRTAICSWGPRFTAPLIYSHLCWSRCDFSTTVLRSARKKREAKPNSISSVDLVEFYEPRTWPKHWGAVEIEELFRKHDVREAVPAQRYDAIATAFQSGDMLAVLLWAPTQLR
ncbi:GPI-anchored surface protein, putative [Bodo saltans]|uniref:GPI-anchored surface protein, putative n=1 Tax=Bodo saltans TaxID=75058 RepID=A0A0S4IKW3_BODSA|nr:GPI-anchored surface protein, putative [Bodo saltans]|eukprot:CUE63586.1 GPI-anchored surface protein, putative [Bodo saltans]